MSEPNKPIDEKLANALGVNFNPHDPSSAQSYSKEIKKKEEPKPEEKLPDVLDVTEESRQSKDEKAMEADFIHTRKTTKRILERGEEMFEDVYRIAQETESARHFEVADRLFKNIIDGNEKLLDMHGKKANIRKSVTGQSTPNDSSGTNIQNQTNIIGTSADLLKMMIENDETEVKKVDNEAKEE